MRTLVTGKRPKKVTKKRNETAIEQSILQFLECLPGCYAWKNPTSGYFDVKRKTFRKQTSKYAINGVSDILGVYQGRFLAIEVKDPQNKERPELQKNFINQVNSFGGIGFFATSIEDVKKELGVQ
jgi:penicillin-binding protein-related factor A (putative recombinase)